MASSLITYLQEYMGTQLPKPDVRTHETNNPAPDQTGKLMQSAMAAALVVLYKFSRSERGAEYLTNTNPEQIHLRDLTAGKELELAEHIANSSGADVKQSSAMTLAVVREALHFVRRELKDNFSSTNLQTYFGAQRQEILGHLPPELGLGEIMGDDTLDDRTNKMEGPVSGLAHAIQNMFSSSGTTKA